MKKTIYIYILLFLQILAFGQTDQIIKHIFFDLPLDLNRTELRKAISSDKRFKISDTISNLFKETMPYFQGHSSEKGVIKVDPDSIEIQLTFGSNSISTIKGNQAESKDVMELNLRYFFNNKDIVKEEYINLLQTLNVALKDSQETNRKITWSANPTFNDFKAVGKIFSNYEPYYTIEILIANFSSNRYALYLTFEKEDK